MDTWAIVIYVQCLKCISGIGIITGILMCTTLINWHKRMCSWYVDKAKNKPPHLNIKTNIFTECIQQLIQWATMKLTVPRLKDTEGFWGLFNFMLLPPKTRAFLPVVCPPVEHLWQHMSFLPARHEKKKRQESILCHKQPANTPAWPDSGTQGDKSVRCIKHFPLFSSRTLPFLPNQTQALQGMPCDGVFLNNCSTFPSFAAHAPPSLLFTARQRIQSPTVNLI